MRRAIRPTLWLVILVFAVAARVSAQTAAGGSVRGTVRDQQGGVLPGVTVTATSPSAPRPTSVVTDAQGYYRLTDLQPGVYVLSATLDGFTRYERQGLDVRAALNLEVDVKLTVGGLAETVQVRAETPMLEVEKPVQAINISGDLQRQLPLLPKKDWSAYLEVTPSVTSLDNGGGYSQVYMVRGSEMEGHVFQLDGTDIGSWRQGRSDAIQLSTDAIQDVQVKTGGVDASAPLGVGVIVNMVTKTGTNAIKGAAGITLQPLSWNGNNAGVGGTASTIGLIQPDLSVGGPILKNRAFFFGAFRYSSQESGIGRNAQQVATLQGLQKGFSPFNNKTQPSLWFLKGTLELSPNHRLMMYGENDLTSKDINSVLDARPMQRDAYGGKAFGGSLSSVWGSTLTTKLAAAWNDKSYTRDVRVWDGYLEPGPAYVIYASTALSGGNRVGTGQVASLNNPTSLRTSPTSKYTVQGDVTWYKAGWGGRHEIQAGFLLQPNNRNEDNNTYLNGGQNQQDGVLNDPNNPAAGYKIFHKTQYAAAAATSKSVKAQDYAFYVQDTWKPVPRLSLSLGVRADKVIADDKIFDLRLENAWSIGPRLGATYQVTGDGKNVLRGSWAIVHDMPQSIMIATVGSTRVALTDYYDNNLDGTFETSLVTPAATTLSANRQVDPKFHQPFMQEAVLGYGRQFPGQLSVDVTLLRRNYKDRNALVDVNGIYDGVVFKGYKDPTQNDIYLITNNTYNWFVYTGLEVSVSKRAKHLQVIGGYTRAWQHIAGTWQPNDPAAFIQPDAFPNDKGIGSWRGNGTNSLAYATDTRSMSWIPHVVRIAATYTLPHRITLSSNLSLMSGNYSSPVYTTIPAADPKFGPATLSLLQPDGSYRKVSNPLSTTYRFAYATRGEGQLQLRAFGTWNVGLDKGIAFGGGRVLTLGVQAFNLTNRGTFQRFNSGANVIGNRNYGTGVVIQTPRMAQVTARFEF